MSDVRILNRAKICGALLLQTLASRVLSFISHKRVRWQATSKENTHPFRAPTQGHWSGLDFDPGPGTAGPGTQNGLHWSKTLFVPHSSESQQSPPTYTSVKRVSDQVGSQELMWQRPSGKSSNGLASTSEYTVKSSYIVSVVDVHTYICTK